MTIKTLTIESYRSIQKLELNLQQLNLITGHNGCGKSNVYKALNLLAQAVNAQLASNIANEGGIPSIMWSGHRNQTKFNDRSSRLNLSINTNEYCYHMSIGIPIPVPRSMFYLDPEVKEERIWIGSKPRISNLILDRKANTTFTYDINNQKTTYPFYLNLSESVLAQLKEPQRYPELFNLSSAIKNWRFYHNFQTSVNSPIRAPQASVRSTVLNDDGSNLAAAIRTIYEIGDIELFNELIADAFNGAHIDIVDPHQKAKFEIKFKQANLFRALEASELSDGTLKYICLVTALLTPRPPEVLILNEPEMSLHPDLIPHLAKLIANASNNSQIIVTSHSRELQVELTTRYHANLIQLELGNNGTQIVGNINLDIE